MTGMENPGNVNLTLPDYFSKDLLAPTFPDYYPVLFQSPVIYLTKGECVQSAKSRPINLEKTQ
jgi:hypothetical protein